MLDLTTEIIRDGRKDILVNPRERFRWEYEVQNSDGTPLNFTGSTLEFFLKPLDLEDEAQVTLDAALNSSSVGPIGVSTIPAIFPVKGFLKIDDEVIRYNSKSANEFDSLVRGDDETIAASHAAASAVTMAGRILFKDGSSTEKLIVTEAAGIVVVYIAQPTLNSFTWSKAEYRLQMIDAAGDPEVLVSGYWTFERRWAQ